MNHLLRELAPVPADAWTLIDAEARQTLKIKLGARKIVDFCGPLGWEARRSAPGGSSASMPRRWMACRPQRDASRRSSSCACPSRCRAPRSTRPRAAPRIRISTACARLPGAAALAEDRAVVPRLRGRRYRRPHDRGEPLLLSEDYVAYPAVVAAAISRLHDAGVTGPYAIALGPQCYTGLSKTTRDGFPVLEHVRRLLNGGPLVWAPGIDGAAVVSMRGGDFELTVGGDWAIGYTDHTADVVRLYLQESFTFRALAPEAAVPLRYAKATQRGH